MGAPVIWKWMKVLNRWPAFLLQRGLGPQKMVLLLTTTGRVSGRPRQTPLQYEISDGAIYVASARGRAADWVRNALANPKVTVEAAGRTFTAQSEVVCDSARIADFLALRLTRHPFAMRLLMCGFEGLPWRFSRADLEDFAAQKALLVIPIADE